MGLATPVRAEWTQENYSLVAGWNAIWVSVDTGYADIDELLAAHPQIEEVWMWNSLVSRSRFTGSGAVPSASDSWLVWRRGRPTETTFSRFAANAACLVRVADGTPSFQLGLLGRPVPPRMAAQSTGVNFVGFPVQTPASGGLRNVERFFTFDAALTATPELFAYYGGPLSETPPQNPRRVPAVRTTSLERGRAYWLNTTAYSEFYGPLRVTLLDDVLDFGADRSYVSLRVKNVADPADAPAGVAFTLSRRASLAPPAGQPALAGDTPLLVRGPRDPDTLQYTFTPLPPTGLTRALQPGEEVEIVLALDRALMPGAAGTRYASILQVADSLNLTRIDLPVAAVVPSMAGVWIGSAHVTQVDQIIGAANTPEADAPGGYELRLILHRAADGQTTLLQKVFLDQPIGGTARTVQPADTTGVSRVSTAAFPLDLAQPGAGQLAPSGVATFPVSLAHNAPTNPFVHTYHPDHDGLDARFASSLPAGVESATIHRAITLTFSPAADNGEPGWGATVIGGDYRETVSGLRVRDVTVSGRFILRRVSDAAVLFNQP